jgi:hypothetical protein
MLRTQRWFDLERIPEHKQMETERGIADIYSLSNQQTLWVLDLQRYCYFYMYVYFHCCVSVSLRFLRWLTWESSASHHVRSPTINPTTQLDAVCHTDFFYYYSYIVWRRARESILPVSGY